MKSSTLLSGILFGIISQTSAAIMRFAESNPILKGVPHATSGDPHSPVIWSSSYTEMQDRIAEGKLLASAPPPKILESDAKSPLAAQNEKSLLGPKGSSRPLKLESEPVQGPVSNGQRLDVNSEQYKMMELVHGRVLKGGHGGGHESHGGGAAAAAGSHNAASNAPFSTKLTWIFLAGNLAMLRRLFNFARV